MGPTQPIENIMNKPTKEELCEAMKKVNEEMGTGFLLMSFGTGGCDGPPCVQVREKASPMEMRGAEEGWVKEIMTKPIEEQIQYGLLYKTIAVGLVEERRVLLSIPDVVICYNKLVERPYYYKKYADVDAIAKTLIRALKRHFKVKVI
jgi:hypothetical protein